jgi:hypothetical protein
MAVRVPKVLMVMALVSHFALVLFSQQQWYLSFVYRLASWSRRVPVCSTFVSRRLLSDPPTPCHSRIQSTRAHACA